MLFLGLQKKSMLEEDFLSTIYYKNGTAEFLRKNRVREKSALEEDRVRGGPPLFSKPMEIFMAKLMDKRPPLV